MHRNGHYGLALLVFAPLAFLLDLNHAASGALIGAVIVAGTAPIPDLDQRIPFLTHRGFTHTVWFLLGASLITGAGTWFAIIRADHAIPNLDAPAATSHPILLAVTVGSLVGLGLATHLLGDVITPMGIKPFAPLSGVKYTLDLTTSKNRVVNMGLFISGLAATGAALYLPHVLALSSS